MGLRLWDRIVVSRAVELCCGSSPIERQRRKVVPLAQGRVLELGVGSGYNLPLYDPERVEEVVGIDPSAALLERAAARARASRVPVQLAQTSAERLEEAADAFDTVVTTYTLCSIPNLEAALSEARRVLRPGGRLLLSEHGKAPDATPARWQRRLDPLWSRLGGGCHLDRDMPALLAAAGFDVSSLEAMYLPGPRWLNWHVWGSARVA